MNGRYILDGHKVVPCDDLMTWGRWMEANERRVKRTKVGDSDVSTVFLGLDHQFGRGAPLLFETMIFGGARDGDQFRYSTWDEAEDGHAKVVAELQMARN